MGDFAQTDSVAVRASDVRRHYRLGEATIRAVDGVSLEIARGKFVALLGASGSGKSSLLNLIAGLDRPTSGEITVFGSNLAQLSREALAQYRLRTVGMVFQAFNLIPSMSLLQNVELPMRFAEVERDERSRRAMEALQRVGLGKRERHKPSELSGGEQQRAALARALVNSPELLLADEPTGNLDSHTGAEIMELIRELNRASGMTVVLVTHERALAEQYASRMIFLGDGRITDERLNAPTELEGARR